MKISHLATLGLLGTLFTANMYANDNKKMPNTAFVKIEVGEFFGLFRKDTAEVKIVMASKNFYGFEGMAKAPVDTTKEMEMNTYMAENISQIMNIEDASCTYSLEKLKTRRMDSKTENENSKNNDNMPYVTASYDVKCDKSIKGHKMSLNFSKFYSIDKITVKLEQPLKDKIMTMSGETATIVLQ